MKIFNISSIDRAIVYEMYEMLKSIKEEHNKKGKTLNIGRQNLSHLNFQMQLIEQWPKTKENEVVSWTKEDIFWRYGTKPILTISFHPGSDSYNKFGRKITVKIDFSDREMLEMYTNIKNKSERKSGLVNFIMVPKNIDETVETAGVFETRDIFEVIG